MKTKTVKIADLTHPEKNVRSHPEGQIRELARSVEMFGQIRPVVIDENGVILAGNGLVMAYRQNGVEEIHALVMEGLSEADKKKLMIADNRTYALGTDHHENIMDFLSDIGDFDVPGYDGQVLEKLLAQDYGAEADYHAVESYGILSEDQKQEFSLARERREEQIQKAHEENFSRPSEPEDDGTVTISCPHCGGHIRIR
jgi:riboflavin synthase